MNKITVSVKTILEGEKNKTKKKTISGPINLMVLKFVARNYKME